jgi:hypothetical protein
MPSVVLGILSKRNKSSSADAFLVQSTLRPVFKRERARARERERESERESERERERESSSSSSSSSSSRCQYLYFCNGKSWHLLYSRPGGLC